ncbi:MAG: hypothetical protein HOC93_02950 [Phycisphaerae bacterium]|nr:hypothetical protein [Phycisphaerae bacterium]
MKTGTTVKSELMLEGILDYAGLYPPANLKMEQVVHNWANYIQSEDNWMLAKLIIPSNRLDEFKYAAVDLLPKQKDEAWQLSVLLPPASSDQFEQALQSTVDFNLESCGAVAHVVEFKASSVVQIDFALNQLHDDIFPFIEIPIDEDPRGLIASLSGAIAGAKVRTGGITKELYPSVSDLARFIHACAAAGQQFKATAGMHHPAQHQNESVGVQEFGFLSVLQATAAASANNAGIDEVENILSAHTPDFSEFSESQLKQIRAEFFVSVGTCSFEDPITDLREMGILKESI